MPRTVVIDFETYYNSKLKYSLKNLIAEQYCQHELFDPYIIAASDGKTCWSGHPKDFNWESLRGAHVLAHNSYFEESVVAEMQRRGWAPKDLGIEKWDCTANMTSFLCNRRSLDEAVHFLLGNKVDKSARSNADRKKWPADFSPEEQKTMLEYARHDAFYSWTLHDRFGGRWPELERRLSRLTINQGRRGVQINGELLDEYICRTHEMLGNTEKVIPWISEADDESWDEFNTKPTSSKCISEQCRRSGIPCPPVKSDDEEGYIAWEETYAPKHPWILAVSAWRSLNKLYKTFLTVKSRLRDDGTMPFALLYFGAHTGRWSGSGGLNMQNMRKIPVFCNELGLMETNEGRIHSAVKHKAATGAWPEWVRGTIDFRNLILPRPGKKMIVSDLSQIEPRVLAWLSGDKALLEMLRGGMSVYEAHARATMGWTGGVLKKENPEMYALAKIRVLGLGYGAGWEKFIKMAMTLGGVDLTANDPEWIEEENPLTGEVERVSGYGFNSKRIVNEFRGQNKNIVALWGSLDDSFKRSIGEDFVMRLPSGREMRYTKVRCEARMDVDPKTKKPRRKYIYTADIGGRRYTSYGGKLTENLVQAASRDVFAEHIVKMEDNGWNNLFSVHDEAVLEVDQDVTARDVEHEMSKCPEWIPGLPVAAEASEVECYTK